MSSEALLHISELDHKLEILSINGLLTTLMEFTTINDIDNSVKLSGTLENHEMAIMLVFIKMIQQNHKEAI